MMFHLAGDVNLRTEANQDATNNFKRNSLVSSHCRHNSVSLSYFIELNSH